MTIHEFIEARLADDAETAQLHEEVFKPGSGMPGALLEQMATPEHLHAEITTKRRLLGLHMPRSPMFNPESHQDRCTACMGGEESWPCKTIRVIATQYEFHPDFNEAWRG